MSSTVSGNTATHKTRDSQAGLEVDHRDVEGGMHTRPELDQSPMASAAPTYTSTFYPPEHIKEDEKLQTPISPEAEPKQQKRVPFGLTPLVFGLVAGLVGFLIGGGLGGGLGAGLASSKSSATTTCPASLGTQIPATTTASASGTASSTSSPTSTPSSNPSAFVYSLPVTNFTVPPYYNVTSYTSCPDTTPAPYTDRYYQSYEFLCGTVYPPGSPADAKYGGVIGDLSSTVAYSIEDCTLMCTLWNTDPAIVHNRVCRSISWVPDINTAFQKYGANCVLKNATGETLSATDPMIVSAKLASTL